jgi:hypothetical protein
MTFYLFAWLVGLGARENGGLVMDKHIRSEEGEIDHFILGKVDGCITIDQIVDIIQECSLSASRHKKSPILCQSSSTTVWSIAGAKPGGDYLTNNADSLLLDFFKQLIIFTHDTSDCCPL